MTPSAKWTIPAAILLAGLSACGEFGRVNQGIVVDYQPDKGLVTLISDSNYQDPAKPRFDVLPPVTVRTPENRSEMGPEPRAGKLVSIDWPNRRAVIFDAAAASLRTVELTPVSEQGGVAANDVRVRGLPSVDRAAGKITAYLADAKKLIVFSVAPEYLALPDDAWRSGDLVRYYYKDPARALRLMNVSRTDLNEAGK